MRSKLSRPALLTLLLLAPLPGQAASAPNPSAEDKQEIQKLAELKRRLPGVVEGWLTSILDDKDTTERTRILIEARAVRRIAPHEAKLSLVMSERDSCDKPFKCRGVITVYLRYFDGVWSIHRTEPTEMKDRDFSQLLLLIEESQED